MLTTVTPVVFYRNPIAAMRFLEAAFGFETTALVTDNEGRVGHAAMKVGDGEIGVGQEWASPDLIGPASLKSPASLGGAGSQFIRVHMSGGLDEHHARAAKAGATITQAPGDQFYGDRTYRALDPEGHVWNFAETVAKLTDAEMEEASGLTFKTSL